MPKNVTWHYNVTAATDRANNVGGPSNKQKIKNKKNSSVLISSAKMAKVGQDMLRFMKWSYARIFI